MNARNKTFLLFTLCCLLFAVIALPVQATNEGTEVAKGLGGAAGLVRLFGGKAGFDTGAPAEPEVIIGLWVQGVMVMIGVIFGILIIYGGYFWMTARGNEEKVKKAIQILTSAIIGFILVIAAYAITSYIVDKVISAAFQ